MTRRFCRIIVSGILTFGTMISLFSQTPVEKHGWLRTQGKYLLNEKGNIVQLKGMSFFWSRSDWYQGSSIGHFYSAEMLNRLVDQWKCTVVRVAYSTDGGNPQGWEHCQTVIDAAIAKGIYVIIDWHAHDAHNHESQAVSFFTDQAQKYLNTPNVIFEPYNEPTTAGQATPEDGSVANAELTWNAIKPYLKNVTKAIRNTGSRNIVALGTPYYCQHAGVAGGDRILNNNGEEFENVVYSFHFYAASHGQEAYYYKEQNEGGGQEARYLENGVNLVPVFITEWGTSHSNGGLDGKNYVDEANTDWWFENWIDKHHLSWCNWSVSDWQASSAFSGGTNPSASGQIVKKYLNNTEDEFEPPWKEGKDGPSGDSVFSMPNRHPAVSYHKYYGSYIKAENAAFLDRDTSDVNGSSRRWLKISEGVDMDWVSYKFDLSSSTKFFILRYLAKDGNGTIEIHVDDEKKGEISVKQTDSWISDHVELDLSPGNHTVKLYFSNAAGTYNLNWLELASDVSTLPKSKTLSGISNVTVSNKSNSIHLNLPESHDYTSFSLLRANGSIYKNGKIEHNISSIKLNSLSKGIWFLKLNGAKKQKYFKTVITGN